jgi:GR25 family glycosyltransferase involved in LPS biosynthesis
MLYFGNEITGICNAFTNFTSNPELYYQVHNQIKANIMDQWGIQNNLDKWIAILDTIFVNNDKILVSDNVTDKVEKEQKEQKEQKELIVAFSDMWPGFNYDDNFFTNMIRHECSFRNITVKGVNYNDSVKANILLCGPYSSGWEKITHIPKIYITAENWKVPNDDSISLYLTPSRLEDETHMRLPTWMTFIDWYSKSDDLSLVNTDNNPNLLPIGLAMSVHPKAFNERDEFCGFVVSNPICKFRNEAFFALNSYKKVNSGGELFNNIGGRLSLKYPGGGCGDIPKLKFFENHKFTLSFENSQAPGYITEKVLHSKMAGCLPIYWGDIDTDSDFVPNSFINISASHSSEDVVKIIKSLEANPEMCKKIASTPILNEEKKQKALYTLSRIAKEILKIALNNSYNNELNGIDKIYAVNLDTRPDRWNSLIGAEPYLEDVVERVSAVNGKTLKMNKFIYDLFKNNQFNWKKSVMGCSLSHMKIWSNIIKESGNIFLVLEDDVRFNKNWIDDLNKYIKNIPEDADILYIGGVLPPNKVALPLCLNKINEYWSKIIPNTFFSSQPIPTFHFCTYSYIITKKGAEKLLQFLKLSDMKSFVAVDHLLGSPQVNLKKYVANTLLTYCFQDNDPNYINSAFNSTDTIKNYDSDILNNNECFTENDIASFKLDQIDLFYFDETDEYKLYEEEWITYIFQTKINLRRLPNLITLIPNNSWFIVQRPHFNKILSLFMYLQQNNINFKVLHLSDEYINDPIDFYTYSNCKCVVRNYIRSDVPNLPHILTIPLGYHYKGINKKALYDRKLIWSFHGTNWFNRQEYISHILNISPHKCQLNDKWDDPNQSKEDYYLDTLENSKFCPILRGNNYETFRLYEALEVGTIPIYVRSSGDDLFWQFISRLGLININSWDTAKQIMEQLMNNPTDVENYRNIIYNNWLEWKKEISMFIEKNK